MLLVEEVGKLVDRGIHYSSYIGNGKQVAKRMATRPTLICPDASLRGGLDASLPQGKASLRPCVPA